MRYHLTVSLCCNDGRGATSALSQIQIHELLHMRGAVEGGEPISITEGLLRVNGISYRTLAHQPWAGNLYWDSVTLRFEDAAQLVNDLAELDHWGAEDGSNELVEAVKCGDVTAEMLGGGF